MVPRPAVDEPFQRYGTGSVAAVRLASTPAKRLDLLVEPRWLLDHPNSLALAEQVGRTLDTESVRARATDLWPRLDATALQKELFALMSFRRRRSANTVADGSGRGCYLEGEWLSSKPRVARLKMLASSRC